MRVLITGGAGFIGSHIAEALQGTAEVRVLDNLRTGYRHNLEGLDVDFIEGSITDSVCVKKAMKGVDYVFHLAAMISVPESMHEPLDCVDINVNGLLNVLRIAADEDVKRLCFSSSSAVYGENPESPKRENMVPDPRSPYAITKLDGEYYCSLFNREKWLSTVSLRYFNVFGPRQDPHSAYAAAIPIFLEKAIKQEPMTIFGDGEQTRDFVYVRDIAAANIYFCTQSQAPGPFNIGYGQSMTVNTLVQQIKEKVDSTSEVIHAEIRPGDVKHSCAAVEAANDAGFKVSGSFVEGLNQTITWWLKHKQQ